jgi:hypothetical protein
MTVDLQVIFPQVSIELNQIMDMLGYTPRTLDVRGADFSSVDEVLINDSPAPNFSVLGRKRLLAQVPTPVGTNHIYSVSVISNRLAVTRESLLRFRIGDTPGKVTGMLLLLQLFVKILLTTPGTDIFSPRLGGGLLAKTGQYTGKDEGKGLVGDVVIAVDNTSRQIISLQSRNSSIPSNERLLAANVISARYTQHDLSLQVEIELLNQAGIVGYANLVM